MFKFILAVVLCAFIVKEAEAHAKLYDPPARNVVWRFPEYASYNPEPQYCDHCLVCGSITWDRPCGICGDAHTQSQPRENELGGRFYRDGLIVRNYNAGSEIEVVIEVNSGHLGTFVFKVCPTPSRANDQSCYDQYPLQLSSGGYEYTLTINEHVEDLRIPILLRLPVGLSCEHCVLQWYWKTGNQGAGNPGEQYANCADIKIR